MVVWVNEFLGLKGNERINKIKIHKLARWVMDQYEVEGRLQPLPCGIFISAGNDGSGALTALRRIMNGYPFREVQEPVIARGAVTDAHLQRCEELGMALAVGLEAGIY